MKKRPLSPHISIYRIQITSLLSILHRATGIALYGGILLWVIWLLALANGEESYKSMQTFLLHPIGLICLLGFSLSFFYHFTNGIRHLLWDIGYGYDMASVRQGGWFVIFFTLTLTFFTWGLGKLWGMIWS
jgi:succinate dehydrogenase / fumarate reductase cytochrome b subunit